MSFFHNYSLRYLQNVDSRGSTPRTPNLDPIAINEEHDRKSTLTQQLSLNRELTDCSGGGGGNSIAESKREAFTRRSQSLESRFECYENNNNNTNTALGGKNSNNSLQLQTKTQLPRKLPALEIKEIPMNVKGK